MNSRRRSIAPPTSSPWTMSPASLGAVEQVDARASRSAPSPSRPSSSISAPGQVLEAQHAGAERVVDVVVDVGDPVDQPHDPALRASPAGCGPVWRRMPSRTCSVRLSRSISSTTRSECSLWRKRVPPALAHARVEHLLADVAERRVAEVVAEPDRLGQVLVEPQRPRHVARDPAGLERVREPGAVVVALGRDEHLRLVLEPPERLGVHDPVAVALERRAVVGVGLLAQPAGRVRARGERREARLLEPLDPLAERGAGELGHRRPTPILAGGASAAGDRQPPERRSRSGRAPWRRGRGARPRSDGAACPGSRRTTWPRRSRSESGRPPGGGRVGG